jgi:hypothetical protein
VGETKPKGHPPQLAFMTLFLDLNSIEAFTGLSLSVPYGNNIGATKKVTATCHVNRRE